MFCVKIGYLVFVLVIVNFLIVLFKKNLYSAGNMVLYRRIYYVTTGIVLPRRTLPFNHSLPLLHHQFFFFIFYAEASNFLFEFIKAIFAVSLTSLPVSYISGDSLVALDSFFFVP